MSPYIPDAGDVIWLTFDPQAGHEQAGRRPALVLSPKVYNERAGLALVCPITSQVKGYSFEVALAPVGKISGVVLADQVRSLDWKVRKAEKIGKSTSLTTEHVLAKLAPLLGF